jgi:nitrate/TMAO reductase-like tetraheme cytochrome c subunit
MRKTIAIVLLLVLVLVGGGAVAWVLLAKTSKKTASGDFCSCY